MHKEPLYHVEVFYSGLLDQTYSRKTLFVYVERRLV